MLAVIRHNVPNSIVTLPARMGMPIVISDSRLMILCQEEVGEFVKVYEDVLECTCEELPR